MHHLQRFSFQLFFAVVLGFFALTAAGRALAGEPFLRGDVDASGGLDLTDATRIFGFLFLGTPEALGCEDRADANDDGEIEVTDGLVILNFLFRGGNPLPPPHRQTVSGVSFSLPGYDQRQDDPFPCGDGVFVGGDRPVAVYEPAGHDLSQPLPLLLLLHGGGGSGDLAEVSQLLRSLADERGFLYATPDGTLSPSGERFWSATDACCDFEGLAGGRPETVDDSSYLRGVIEEIEEKFNVDPARIFVAGSSNGGFMSHRMACDHADKVRAVVSLAGMTYADEDRCTPAEPIHVLSIHGTMDTAVRPAGGLNLGAGRYPSAQESAEYWANYNRCSPEAEEAAPLDLAYWLPGEETRVRRFRDGCLSGGSSELWLVEGALHVLFVMQTQAPPPWPRNPWLWPAILDWLWAKTASSYIDVSFTAMPEVGEDPLEILVDASASTTTADAIVSHEWDFGDGQTGQGMVVEHIYTTPGAYRIELVVTDSLGNERRLWKEVKVQLRSEAVEPWQQVDIGSVAAAGGSRLESDCLLVAGAEGGIGGASDQFRYAYQVATGNVRLTARLRDWTATEAGSQVGLMVRESLEPRARHGSVLLEKSPGDPVLENPPDVFLHTFSSRERILTRPVTHETYERLDLWLQLERAGDAVRGRLSTNGDNWTEMDEVILEGLSDEVFVGVAAAASERDLGVASFCEIELVTE